MRFRAALFLGVLIAASTMKAQTQEEVDSAVAKAVARNLHDEDELKHYVYVEDSTHSNDYDNGQKHTAVRRETYEHLIVAGKPYLKLTARDGKPLKGREAKGEEKRYQEAMAKGEGFREEDHIEEGTNIVYADDSLDDIPAKYHCTLKNKQSDEDKALWMIDCNPKSDSGLSTTFILWIDPQSNKLWKYRYDIREDKKDLLIGTWGLHTYVDERGVMLPLHSELHFRTREEGRFYNGMSERDFLQYRRFQATARIVSIKPNENGADGKPAPQK